MTASDGREYNREGLKANPMDLVYSLLVMIRAHEESDTKSKRVKAAIRRLCEQWLAGTYRGIIRNGKDPKWLEWREGQWHLIPERVEAVRTVVTLFRDGHGSLAIVDRLKAAGLSVTGFANTASYFYKMLRLGALIGTKTLNVDGVEYRLQRYYPAILDQGEYDELQALVKQRGRRKGKGEIPGIITGIKTTYCGYCASAMIGQNLMSRGRDGDGRVHDGYRRLACSSDQTNRKCPVSGSTSIAPIERAILNYCSDQIKLNNLLDSTVADLPVKQRLADARSRCAELETQTERLTNAILQDSGDALPLVIMRKMRELEASLERAKRDAGDAEAELSSLSRKTPAKADAWKELVTGVKKQNYDDRLKARQLVMDTFSRIVIYRYGVQPSESDGTILDMVLIPHGGQARVLRIHRKTGDWIAGDDVLIAESSIYGVSAQ